MREERRVKLRRRVEMEKKKKKEEREREREVLERVTKGSARQAAGGAAIPGHGSITLLYC